MIKILFLFCIFFLSSSSVLAQTTTTITLDSNTRYQTITGWEGVNENGQDTTYYSSFQDQLMNEEIDTMGINRIRLEVRAGSENSHDYWTDWKNGLIGMDLRDANGNLICPSNTSTIYYRYFQYRALNDDNDPNSVATMIQANPSRSNFPGFVFSELDNKIDKVIVPYRDKMSLRGKKLYLNVINVAFTSQICSIYDSQYGHYDHINLQKDPNMNEYAEYVLATLFHIKNKYDIVPDSYEIILEPDNTIWSGNIIGKAMVTLRNKLDQYSSYGFDKIKLIGPSVSHIPNMKSYTDGMIAEIESAGKNVDSVVEEISYHRYTGPTDGQLQYVANLGLQYGVNTSMLEHIGSTYVDLHKDLKIANVSAWEQFSLAGTTTGFSGGGRYYAINDTNPGNITIQPYYHARYLQSYFHYIHPGAVRIKADTPTCADPDFHYDPNLTVPNSSYTYNCSGPDPVAFINPDGTNVVVVKTTSAATFDIQRLPTGTYGVNYTTGNGSGNPSVYSYDEPNDQSIIYPQAVSASIPSQGVITIYGTTAGPTPTPTPTPSPTPTPDITGSLVAHWNFDEGAGTTATDTSGSGNNGTLVNNPTWTTGKVGSYALSFDGSNAYVQIPDTLSLDISKTITVAAWVKFDSIQEQYIISKGSGVLNDISWSLSTHWINPNEIYFLVDKDGTLPGDHFVVSSNANLIAGQWYHLAATYDFITGVMLYKDGVLLNTSSSTANPGGININTQPITIGSNATLGNPLHGEVDDLRIYNAALSQAQILDIKNGVIILIGDLNNDSQLNIQDIVILINEIFSPSGLPNSDVNNDSKVDLIDIIYLINIIFS
ncbi:hypothetical protein COV24_00880 [candidate division WWE3 bacterium CG10_big_fil_rev_8_21_14_0_10_32_10]|uniref:Dockerin domain-containing protein n=1 Tax=candidate division WWE3 bacterium CG10_big_fil_rev_8_21_14_0_10_32_10 TaxID=1975090 RepID=A0A2H0RB82_UNCKA|nr:MAG: hypothetical protein COV24_00880 [candidate division WWE3 bacterium CG10_big_fil_rev_8_21_14_0_10_32_10]